LGSRRKGRRRRRRRRQQEEKKIDEFSSRSETQTKSDGGFMDSDKMFNQEVVSLCLYMHRQVASRLITKIRGENAVLIKESIKTTKKKERRTLYGEDEDRLLVDDSFVFLRRNLSRDILERADLTR
jgi:hypothetical protein